MIQTRQASDSLASPPRRIDFDDAPIQEARIIEPLGTLRRVWGSAIFAGVVTAIALQVVFSLLGIAIGLSAAGSSDAAAAGRADLGQAGIAASVWWFVTGLVSLFIGTYIAGRMIPPNRGLGAAHGFLTWATVTVVSVALAIMGSALAGGAMVGGGLSALGSLNPKPTPMQSQSPAVDSSAGTNPERYATAQLDAERSDMQPRADQAAENSATASWLAFAALLFGAGVSCAGGMAGAFGRTTQNEPQRRGSTSRSPTPSATS